MTLEEFAKLAGMEIVVCDKECGGTVGYTTTEYPNCTIAGFRTEKAALKSWLKETFGDRAGKAVIKLLKQSEVKK